MQDIKTLEEKLKAHEESMAELKQEIESLKADKPKVGDFCKFWDDDPEMAIYGQLRGEYNEGPYKYKVQDTSYEHCEKADFSPTDISFVEAMNNPERYEITWGNKGGYVPIDVLGIETLGNIAKTHKNAEIRRIEDK